MIDAWNSLAADVVSFAAGAALTSAILFVVVGLVWTLLRRRASVHLGAALFVLPLVPLVAPLPTLAEFEVTLPTAVAQRMPMDSAPTLSAPSDVAPSVVEGDGASDLAAIREAELAAHHSTSLTSSTPTGSIQRPAARPSVSAWVLFAWAFVCAVLLSRFALSQLATLRVIRRARETAPLDLRLRVGRLARRVGLRRVVRVVETQSVGAPAAWGIGRPTLLLPPDLAERLDDSQLDWVLLHELAHLARRDALTWSFQQLVQILWFFHPLVWWSNRTARELTEQACDEAALAHAPHALPERCADALLVVAAGPPQRPRLALQTLTPEVSLMKKRLLHLLDRRTPATASLAPSSLPLLALLASVPLASVSWSAAPATPFEPSAETEPQVPPHHRERAAPRIPEETERPSSDDLLPKARVATDRAVTWILAQQSESGSWPTGVESTRPTGEVTVVGMTGFAILTLIEAQQQIDSEAIDEAIHSGLAWLGAQYDGSLGAFGKQDEIRFLPSHFVATWAWIRGHRGQPEARWRSQAEGAVALIQRARNPYMAWRYDFPPAGDNDSVMTSLALLALSEAKAVGIEVPRDVEQGGFGFLDEMLDPVTGRTGYSQPGEAPSRLWTKKDAFPGELSELCTAIVIQARLAWGQDPIQKSAIRKGSMLLVDQAPTWDTVRGTVDSYYWTFGTHAMAELGGYTFEYWRSALADSLVPRQLEDGSWPSFDAWSEDDATVHATVMHTWSLLRALR